MCSGFNTSGFSVVGNSTGGLFGKASILKDHSLNNLIGGGSFAGDTKKGMAAIAAKNEPKPLDYSLKQQSTQYANDDDDSNSTQQSQQTNQRNAIGVYNNANGTNNTTGAPVLLA